MNVGLIGLKSDLLAWNDVDKRMHGRTKVVAVWDAVAARTQIVEREGDRRDGDRRHRSPSVYRSISKLAAHRVLDGCVVLSAGWTGLWSARRVAEEGVPVLWLADWPTSELDKTSTWAFSGLGRDLITPGLRLRYLPATLRLRELIATNLGTVHKVTIKPGQHWPKWELADWSNWIVGTHASKRDSDAAVWIANDNSIHASAIISCEHGIAEWTATAESETPALRWQSHSESEWITVDTTHDRPAENVLLDLFFRRVAGGLIPLPSVDDVETAIRIGDAG